MKANQKIYKPFNINISEMLPSDLSGSLDEFYFSWRFLYE